MVPFKAELWESSLTTNWFLFVRLQLTNFFGTSNDSSFRPIFSVLDMWLFSYGGNWTVAYSCYNGDFVCLSAAKQLMLAVGDSGGTLHILEVPWSLSHPSTSEVSSCPHLLPLYSNTHAHPHTSMYHTHTYMLYMQPTSQAFPKTRQYIFNLWSNVTNGLIELASFPGLPCFYLLFAFTFPLHLWMQNEDKKGRGQQGYNWISFTFCTYYLSDFNIRLINNLRLYLWHHGKNVHNSVHCV